MSMMPGLSAWRRHPHAPHEQTERTGSGKCLPHSTARQLERCGTAPAGRSEIETSSDPLNARATAGGGGRPRLGYAGGTRRSVQSVGLNAVEMTVRQTFDFAHDVERNCASCPHGEDGGRGAETPERYLDCRIRIIMVEIGRVVYMSHFIIAAVRMDMAGE